MHALKARGTQARNQASERQRGQTKKKKNRINEALYHERQQFTQHYRNKVFGFSFNFAAKQTTEFTLWLRSFAFDGKIENGQQS